MDTPKVYDQQGQEKDWDWLVANFGPIELERTCLLYTSDAADEVVPV